MNLQILYIPTSTIFIQCKSQKASADTLTGTHQCCFLESLGVLGLTTDTLVQATRPRLIRPRPVSQYSAVPTATPPSARATWELFLQPPCCYLWLFFFWDQLSPVLRPSSGCGWRLSCCPPTTTTTSCWKSTIWEWLKKYPKMSSIV